MAFTEDLAPFISDFGLPCIAGAQQFMGLLDQPDELQQLQRGGAHTREYNLTYISTQATLTRGEAVAVAGVAYSVREAPRQVGDGAFSAVLLSKV